MKRLNGFEDHLAYQGGFLSIGNFDGVHRGHQAIVRRLVELAQARGVKAVVLTFEPHPAALLAPEKAPPRLTTSLRKSALLGELGVDVVIEYPTDRTLLELSPEQFFENVIRKELRATGMVEGPNFFFGKDRRGDIRLLDKLCLEAGMSFESLSITESQGELISSSAIRQQLRLGHVAQAARMLGRDYEVSGTVATGARRGRDLNFATANLTGIETMLPADGVYAAIGTVGNSHWGAAVNIGPNPTFGDANRKVEAHLLGFAGDLYGRQLQLRFIERIRDTAAFSSAADLQQQIQSDVQQCRELTTALLAAQPLE